MIANSHIKLGARHSLLGGAALLGALAGTAAPAVAQQQSESAGVEDIVVTAQKRSESVETVSASLSVMTGQELEDRGVGSALALQDETPNVAFGRAYDGAIELTIRGVASTDNTDKGDPATALHIDGVYVARPQAASAAFYDLERVEVLRGPQGTLYGRNATAGAINLISRRPENAFSARLEGSAGNYNSHDLNGMLNVPLSDTWAVRGVVSYAAHDGYSNTTNSTNGFEHNQDDLNSLSGRVLIRGEVTPNLTLLAGLDAFRTRDHGGAALESIGGQIPYDRIKNNTVEGQGNHEGVNGFVQVDYDAGPVNLTYEYGYRDFEMRDILDLTTSAGPFWANNEFDVHQNSHELRAASDSDGPLEWVVGLYYFKEEGERLNFDLRITSLGFPILQYLQGPILSESVAVFGQATYSLTDTTRVIAGVRQTWDDKSRLGTTSLGGAPPIPTEDAADTWSQFTWRAGVEHDFAEHVMGYATVATGYKAGGFNDGNALSNPSLYYQPEEVTSYEVGLRGRAFDNRLLGSVDAFYSEYSNLQKSTVSNNSLVTVNAAQATIYGMEAEARLIVAGGDGVINFGLGLLNAKYETYVAPDGTDLSGRTLDRAPEVTLNLGYTHDWSLTPGLRLTGYVGTRYMASYVVSDPGTAILPPTFFEQDATTNTDISLTLSDANDRWSLQAYGRNLEDEARIGSLVQAVNVYSLGLTEPGTYGIRLTANF